MSYPPPPSPAYPPGPAAGGPPPGKVRLRGRVPRILGWTFLGLAVALFVAGVVVVGTKSYSKVNGFQRVPVPTNNSTVRFDSTGKYVAYYEAGDVNSDIREVPAVVVAMQAPDGSVMRITHGYKEHSDGKIDIFTYDYNGHKGVGLYEFNITQTGVYHVATRPTPSTASDAQIAFGKDISGGAVAGGVLVVIGIVFGVAAIVLLIVGYVKRSNHKGELQRGQQYWGGGMPAPAYGGQPPANYGAPQGFAPPPGGYQPPPQQSPPAYDQPGYGQPPPPGYQPPPPPGYQPPAPPEGAPEQPSFGDPTAPPNDDSAER
jgi:hypothetical protein